MTVLARVALKTADNPLREANTAAQNSAALTAYLIANVNTNGTAKVLIEPGDYLLDWNPTLSTLIAAGIESVVLRARGEGVVIKHAVNVPAITWDASSLASASLAVTSISTTTHNSSDYISRIAFDNDPAVLTKHGRFNIQSQDRPEFSASSRYVGESGRVRTADATGIWADKQLEFGPRSSVDLGTLLTTPVIRQLSEAITLRTRGIRFEADGDSTDQTIDAADGRGEATIRLVAAVECYITDCEFDAPWYVSVRMESCVDCYVRGAHFSNGLNNPASNQLTYGVQFYGACYNCWLEGSESRGNRHTVTTDGVGATTYSVPQWAQYGQPTWCGARDCYAYDSKGAPWDTHEEGAEIHFINCHSVNAHTGDEAGAFTGAAFQIRARRVTIRNCSGLKGNTGISWKPYEHGADHWLKVINTEFAESTLVSDTGRGIVVATGGALTNRPRLILDNVMVDRFGLSLESDLAVDIDATGFRSRRPMRGHIDLATGCVLRSTDMLWDSRSQTGVFASDETRTLFGINMAGTASAHILGLRHILGDNATKHTASIFAHNDTTKTPTAITKANPGVVTSAAHGYSSSNELVFYSVGGMTQLNGQRVTITVTDANTYSIGVDTSAYGTFSGSTGRTILAVDKQVSLTRYEEIDPSAIGRRLTHIAGVEKIFKWNETDATLRIAKNGLPVAGKQGRTIFLTDEVGGAMPAWDNGSLWKRYSDGATAS